MLRHALAARESEIPRDRAPTATNRPRASDLTSAITKRWEIADYLGHERIA